VYLQFANSEPALLAYLQMEASLKAGGLSDLEIEAIKLAVSQINQCEYCLAIHTMKSKKLGIDAARQLAVRRGKPTSDQRLDTLLEVARSFFEQRGPLPDVLIERARLIGISDGELVDVAMIVSTIFFTNITNHINNTEVTLPPAPPI